MNTVERISAHTRRLEVSDRPVMVNDWAESLADLECARSRRRHPSNREPAWAKDGGYDDTEWDIWSGNEPSLHGPRPRVDQDARQGILEMLRPPGDRGPTTAVDVMSTPDEPAAHG